MKTKKPVKAIPSSPAVSNVDGKLGANSKHSTGPLGRAHPYGVDKRAKGRGNPAGVAKK